MSLKKNKTNKNQSGRFPHIKTGVALSSALLMVPGLLFAQGNEALKELDKKDAAIIEKVPLQNSKESNKIYTDLGKDADALIPFLSKQLSSTKSSDLETTSRFAINGLTWNVGQKGSDKEKNDLAKQLISALEKQEDPLIKDFLLEQLQFLNVKSAADAAKPYLTDKALAHRAVRTMILLKADNLGNTFLTSLNDAKTSEAKIALLQGLSIVKDVKESSPSIVPLIKDEDPAVQEAAYDAIANIGEPALYQLLKARAQANTSFADQQAYARYLKYAERLAAKDDKKLASQIAKEVAAAKLEGPQVHLKGLALTTLADIDGEAAIDELLKYITVDEEDVRAAALANINRFKGEKVTVILLEQLKKSPDTEVTVAILDTLGNRKDKKALPDVYKALDSTDQAVKLQAIETAAKIDRAGSVSELLTVLKGSDKAEIAAVINQLASLPNKEYTAAAGKAFDGLSKEGQVAVLETFSVRRAADQKEVVFKATSSEDNAVKSAAFKALEGAAEASDLKRLADLTLTTERNADKTAVRKAYASVAKNNNATEQAGKLLLEVYKTADDAKKAAVLESLAALSDKSTLAEVVKEAQSASGDVQNAAVRALSDWQSEDALNALFDIASKSDKEVQQVLAARGYVRLASGIKDEKAKFEALKKSVKVVKSVDEKKALIAALGEFRNIESLKILNSYLGSDETKTEAAAAIVKAALPANKKDAGLNNVEAQEILQNALPGITDEKVRKSVEKFIYGIVSSIYKTSLPTDSDGYSVLFNGKDMTGWVGDTTGYSVENGALVCKKESGGKLFTEREFGDFSLKFEYRMEPGANNGVGIRSPLFGDPAFDGYEIQILDDANEKWTSLPADKALKPYQRNGAVYGISTPEVTEFKPSTEWNTREIIAKGDHIKVIENGKVITDVKVKEATANGSLDGRPHPGASRNNGHIGFLGHGAKVEFKNIRVKNLQDDVPEGFTSLFNEKNLDGWKGLLARPNDNPIKRKALSADDLKAKQDEANKVMTDHWDVADGVLFFDGEGSHLCTTKDYGNFEMRVDWAIVPGGDNGVYLRGTPQVQIWDPHYWPQGSGGLYNNQKNTSNPLELADNPIGQWNRFDIKMVGEKVTIKLNDKLIVDQVPLENYWDRKEPIFPKEQIELQSHGSPAWFRNVFIKELPE